MTETLASKNIRDAILRECGLSGDDMTPVERANHQRFKAWQRHLYQPTTRRLLEKLNRRQDQ